MSSFKEKVYDVVREIPRGRVATYAYVARRLGNPRAYRAVGNALNQNRSKEVPCHRVVCSNGVVGGYAWGSARKKEILKKEGVLFCKDKIDPSLLLH